MAQHRPKPPRYTAALEVIGAVEPRIATAIVDELANQRRQLKLIASENYASPAVLLAMGTWFSDKYAEGTPGHRFYAGCEVVDQVESLAAEHARALFGADHAYVQPHSGHRRQPRRVLVDPRQARRAPSARGARRQPRERPRSRRVGGAPPRAQQPAHDRHVARRGRAPHARLPSQHLGQALRPAELRRRSRHRADRLRRGARSSRTSSARSSSSPATPRTRATRTSASCARSPTRSTRRSWSTWRTSPGSSPVACSPATSTRCRTRTSSRRRRTSRCAGPAAGSCSARASTPSSSTRVARRCSADRCRT